MPTYRIPMVVLAVALLPPAPQQGQPQPTVRFHHLHFRSDDPADAMAEVIRTAGGTRAIVPGLGTGVRLDDVYVLFDRSTGPDASTPVPPGVAVASAVRWLEARRIEVRAAGLGERLLAAVTPEVLDHVAFAADDVTAIEQLLRSTGIEPTRRQGESVFYHADGVLIELTADTGRPDRFWCPMHPHVRSPGPQTCPICSMALVPIAPPRAGQYRLEVTQVPAHRGGGIRALKLRIRDPDSHAEVQMFAEAHERLLHLFIIGRDLRSFAHEHPRRTIDGFELAVDLPPGAYMLIADFLPGGGYPQMVHRAIVTPGFRASAFDTVPLKEDVAEKAVDGMRVQMKVEPSRGHPAAILRFRLTDEADAAITDLEPYLGSAGHLLVVSPDLTQSIHAHPDALGSGPELAFNVEFPEAGIYKLWVQMQRRGKVSAVPFVVRIGS
jgi:Heavy metal binding domain